uniref:Bifunctional inhibitor/plant lipid transfer protein/seed storage helical domain-containing protein n=1 Tax=Oryza meridionalis TaxID=40149 RepID=A0A0E0CA45_9ORYZ
MWGTTAAAARRLCAAGAVCSVLAMLACGAKAGDAALDVTACTALVHGFCNARAAMWRKPGGCSI